MNEQLFSELSAWVTQAGLTGTPELTLSLSFAAVVSPLDFHSLGA